MLRIQKVGDIEVGVSSTAEKMDARLDTQVNAQ